MLQCNDLYELTSIVKMQQTKHCGQEKKHLKKDIL